MKKIILIIMLFPIFGFTQFSNNYKEFNGGLYIGGEDVPVFPGISFLIGKTNYYSNNIVLDYEIGFALPTIFTGKVGVGLGDQNNATIIGLRPWPSTAFIQQLWNQKRLISIEIMLPHDKNFNGGADNALIFNYGYRW
tara:strand:- start:631 stop:1044 length:414 start_codon:yes stop_codon:yes gene_type:complete